MVLLHVHAGVCVDYSMLSALLQDTVVVAKYYMSSWSTSTLLLSARHPGSAAASSYALLSSLYHILYGR